MPMGVSDLPSFLGGGGSLVSVYTVTWNSMRLSGLQNREDPMSHRIPFQHHARPNLFTRLAMSFPKGGGFSGVDTLEMVMGIPFFLL